MRYMEKCFLILLIPSIAQLQAADLSINAENRSENSFESNYYNNKLNSNSIAKIDVICNSDNGMYVTVDFLENFNGIIYSQGYFHDPACRYVDAGENRSSFAFNVPFDGCGSISSCSHCSSVENVLIIQNRNDIQDIFDTARKVSCSRNLEEEKTLFFKPFVVDTLEVISVETSSGPVTCWMEIGTGRPPNLDPINNAIRLGDDITFTININSTQYWDVNIFQCFAYDSADFSAPSTKNILLSDLKGCTVRKNLFADWKIFTTMKGSQQISTYYNTLKAFKFPDKPQVFLKCDIELCNGQCSEKKDCSEMTYKTITEKDQICFPGSLNPTCKINAIKNGETKNLNNQLFKNNRIQKIEEDTDKKCFPGSSEPNCEYVEPNVICDPGSPDPFCVNRATLEKQKLPMRTNQNLNVICNPDSKDPECLNCFPGSPDPRCPKVPSTNKPGCHPESDDPKCKPATYLPPISKKRVTVATTQRPQCYPGSKDLSCSKVGDDQIKTSCYPGSKDPLCASSQPDVFCTPESLDPKCKTVPKTPSKICYPGSNDPKCKPKTYLPPTTSRPLIITVPTKQSQPCYPGSRDPRCLKTNEDRAKKPCLPGSRDPNCKNVEPNVKCDPGSPDPRCVNRATSEKPNCYQGSTDPRCKPSTYFPPTTTERNFIGTTFQQKIPVRTTPNPHVICSPDSTDPECLNCFPGSPDPRCPKVPTTMKPGCYPGSDDPKCKPATYLPPISKERSTVGTTQRPKCYPGSKDLSCSKVGDDQIKTSCYPGSKDPLCASSQPDVFCTPESLDPKCKTVPKTPSKICYPGSNDPKCKPKTYLPPTTSRPLIITVPTKQSQPCYPGSRDPKCSKTNEDRAKKPCLPGSRDPNCKNVEPNVICDPGSPDPRCVNRATSEKPNCYQGSTDPRCKPSTYFPPTTTERNFIGTTFQQKIPVRTTPNPHVICSPDSTDPECLNCFPGSPDPRCPKVPTTLKPGCYPGSDDPKCKPATYLPPISKERSTVGTTQRPKCYPGSKDPRCPKVGDDEIKTPCYSGSKDPLCASSQPDVFCTPGSLDPKCLTVPKTTSQICYPGSNDPKCKQETYLPPTTSRTSIITVPTKQSQACYPGSRDPKCSKTNEDRAKKPCLPGSRDPNCKNVEPNVICDPGSPDPRCVNRATSEKPNCYQGSTDPRCKPSTYFPPTTTERNFIGTTFQQKIPVRTTPNPHVICSPDSTDPECLNCFPGSPDPRCPKVPTTLKPGCYPGSDDPKCKPATYLPPISKQRGTVGTTQRPKCYSGSKDPRCPKVGDDQIKTPCYPGSKDPLCASSQPDVFCTPGSLDPKCLTVPKTTSQICYPGSNDPKCKQETYLPPTTSRPLIITVPTKQSQPCYSGSRDPKCSKTNEDRAKKLCLPGSRDPNCKNVEPNVICDPGSPDSRCVNRTTSEKPNCYQGSTDPRCKPSTYFPPTTTERNFVGTTFQQQIPVRTTPNPHVICSPDSKDPECLNCFPGSPDPRCPKVPTTLKPGCYSGSDDPKCKPATYLPPISKKRVTVGTTQRPKCYPGSKDPSCPKVGDDQIKTPCYPGSKDPLCASSQPDVFCTQGSLDPKCKTVPKMPSKICYPGSNDPKCKPKTYLPPTTSRPLIITVPTKQSQPCYPGSRDPKCSKTNEDRAKMPCLPGSRDPNCKNVEPNGICDPGSPDPHCVNRVTSVKPNCYQGSTDPRCKPSTYFPPTTTERNFIGTTFQQKIPVRTTSNPHVICSPDSKDPECLNCFPGSPDPRCPKVPTTLKPGCYPGSDDPKCKPATYLPPISKERSTVGTTQRPKCYPGSKDPSCPKVGDDQIKTPCYPGSKDPLCASSQPDVFCTQGSLDPKCKTVPKTPSKICYPGSNDPKCKPKTYLPPTTSRPLIITVPTKQSQPCYPGSRDPKCSKTNEDRAKMPCLPGSRDPNCKNVEPNVICDPGSLDPHCVNRVTSVKPNCYQGSTDPRCKPSTYFPPTTTERNFIGTTFQQKIPVKTTSNPHVICSPDSKDPECLNCFPGSPDHRCPKVPTTLKPGCYPGSDDPKCKPATYLPPISKERVTVATTQRPKCYPGSKDPSCPKKGDDQIKTPCYPGSKDPLCASSQPDVFCTQGSLDPKCKTVPKTPSKICYPESNDPKCKPKTYLPPTTSRPSIITVPTKQSQPCYPGSRDPKCSKTNEDRAKKLCLPGSRDPNCKNVEPNVICDPGSPDPRCVNRATSEKPNCYQGSTDPRCKPSTYFPPTTTERNFIGTTFQQKIPVRTTSNPQVICSPDSKDPECLNCFPGSPDPRCPKVPTTLKPGCYPGSDDPKCKPATYLPPISKERVTVATTQRPKCYPGSKDPSCSKVGDNQIKTPCYPGSKDPLCASSQNDVFCTPGSLDPQCLTVPKATSQICYPGSNDPKCKQETYFPPTTSRPQIISVPTKQSQPCYPGSRDPKCSKTNEDRAKKLCLPGSRDPNCKNVEPNVICDPGSPDPRCVNRATSEKPNCYQGSTDPRCKPSTYFPPTTTERNFIGTTFQQKIAVRTTSNPQVICSPDSKDPECLNCFPGSPDPRCPKVPTTLKPGCYPGSDDPKCKPATYLPPISKERVTVGTTQRPKCYSGSKDPSCPKVGDDQIKTPCYPGSKDPLCTSSQPDVFCTPGSLDPKCLTIPKTTSQICYPGSNDPKCTQTTYIPPKSTPRGDVPTKSPECYPGTSSSECCDRKSDDPRCSLSRQFDTTTLGNFHETSERTPIIITPTPNYCFPGSIDPRCPNSGYIGTSRVPATYLPPLVNSVGDRNVRESRLSLFDEINKLSIDSDLVDLEDGDIEELSRLRRSLGNNANGKSGIKYLHNDVIRSKGNISETTIISITLGTRSALEVI